MRRAAGRLLLVVAGLVVALGLAEVALRLGHLAPSRYPRTRTLENADKSAAIDAYPTDPRGDFDLDLRDVATRARLGSLGLAGLDQVARRTPHAVEFRYNSHLCRDREVGARVPGVARVLMLGDSFTEGQGVREADTFARRLEGLLRARGRSVEVINCGRRGEDLPALSRRFLELQAYQPDVVVYAMVLNDAVQSDAFRARQAYLNDWIVDRRRMLSDDDPGGLPPGRWRLAALLGERIETLRVGRATTRWYQDMYGPANREGWQATQRHLALLRNTMQARGGRLVVDLLPLLVGLRGAHPFGPQIATVHRACGSLGIPFIDGLAAVRGRDPESLWVHPVDLHPNAVAHRLFAEQMAPVVERVLEGVR